VAAATQRINSGCVTVGPGFTFHSLLWTLHLPTHAPHPTPPHPTSPHPTPPHPTRPQEESIATATIEARQAAQRAKEEAERGLSVATRSGPSASHLYGRASPYDVYDTGLGDLSLQEGEGRLLRPAPLGTAQSGGSGNKEDAGAEGGEGG
jgi:hypothetical protein